MRIVPDKAKTVKRRFLIIAFALSFPATGVATVLNPTTALYTVQGASALFNAVNKLESKSLSIQLEHFESMGHRFDAVDVYLSSQARQLELLSTQIDSLSSEILEGIDQLPSRMLFQEALALHESIASSLKVIHKPPRALSGRYLHSHERTAADLYTLVFKNASMAPESVSEVYQSLTNYLLSESVQMFLAVDKQISVQNAYGIDQTWFSVLLDKLSQVADNGSKVGLAARSIAETNQALRSIQSEIQDHPFGKFLINKDTRTASFYSVGSPFAENHIQKYDSARDNEAEDICVGTVAIATTITTIFLGPFGLWTGALLAGCDFESERKIQRSYENVATYTITKSNTDRIANNDLVGSELSMTELKQLREKAGSYDKNGDAVYVQLSHMRDVKKAVESEFATIIEFAQNHDSLVLAHEHMEAVIGLFRKSGDITAKTSQELYRLQER